MARHVTEQPEAITILKALPPIGDKQKDETARRLIQQASEAFEAMGRDCDQKVRDAQRQRDDTVAHARQESMRADAAEHLLRVLKPEVQRDLYSPMWSRSASTQAVPNRLWLATSIALIALGAWVVFA